MLLTGILAHVSALGAMLVSFTVISCNGSVSLTLWKVVTVLVVMVIQGKILRQESVALFNPIISRSWDWFSSASAVYNLVNFPIMAGVANACQENNLLTVAYVLLFIIGVTAKGVICFAGAKYWVPYYWSCQSADATHYHALSVAEEEQLSALSIVAEWAGMRVAQSSLEDKCGQLARKKAKIADLEAKHLSAKIKNVAYLCSAFGVAIAGVMVVIVMIA
jgi:hypothetical protein